jgi:hypothetical protein
VGGVLLQVLELVSMRSMSACCSPVGSWKLPMLSSVPAAIAEGSIVIVGGVPDPAGEVPSPGPDTTCEKLAGSGSEVQ